MKRTVYAIVIFSIAMAGLESAVVVYLRQLYYPDGFTVALKIIDVQVYLIEIVREVTTLIMLGAVAYLAGKTSRERLAWFLVSFAVWDIFYYVWLKVFIDWPATLVDWDILFLIPWAWLGPVLAPLILSVTMIMFGWVLLMFPKKQFGLVSKSLITLGVLAVLYTFLIDYGMLIAEHGIVLNQEFIAAAEASIPQPFNWIVFSVGEVLLLVGIVKR